MRRFGWGFCLLVAFGCDDTSDTGGHDVVAVPDTAAVVDTGQAIGPGDQPPKDALQPLPASSCVGLADSKTIPQALHDFCADKLTDALLKSGDTCFTVPKPDDPKGPYCVLCALKGGTQKLCLQQVIP